jgi:drug/metabolite transporter (DMT)-like permease
LSDPVYTKSALKLRKASLRVRIARIPKRALFTGSRYANVFRLEQGAPGLGARTGGLADGADQVVATGGTVVLERNVTESVVAGIGWMVLTTLCFVAVTGLVRTVGATLPAAEAAFIRYLFGILLFLPLLGSLLRRGMRPAMLKIHVIRGVCHGIAVILWFFAMTRIPIAEVTALGYTAPIFVTIGAGLFLGETLHLRRIIAIGIGLFGAIVILRPGFSEISAGQLAQLAAAPLFATSYLLAKHLTDVETPITIVAMLSVMCSLVLMPAALLDWVQPKPIELFWLALTAVAATLGHYTMMRAFAAAPLTVTQPIGFLQLVWATLLGILLFGEPVDPFVLIGGGIVIGSATFISHREAAAARRATTPPAVATKT